MQLDLSCVGRYEDPHKEPKPKLSDDVIVPILTNIIEVQGSCLNYLHLPKKWCGYRNRSRALDEVLELYSRALEQHDLETVVRRGLAALGDGIVAEEACIGELASQADGDARRALNLLELAADLAEEGRITRATLQEVLQASL